jgi:hypothetical protein
MASSDTEQNRTTPAIEQFLRDGHVRNEAPAEKVEGT